jgi:hypothetical protein
MHEFFNYRHNKGTKMSTSNEPITPTNLSFPSIPLTQNTNDSISSVGLTSPVDVATKTQQKPSFLSSGIPLTPEKVLVTVQNEANLDEEYDTENEIGPFFDQVEDEGDLEFEEEPLESTELTVPTVSVPTVSTLNECNSQVIIPEQASLDINSVCQMKMSELKEALSSTSY